MDKAFSSNIESKLSFLKTGKLLLGISGGIDSVVLCHLLLKNHLDFSLAHCNFGLRGAESEKDMKFVSELAKSLNLKLYLDNPNTTQYAKGQSISIQMAARDLRYKWFSKLMEEHGYDFLLTAHHADDNLETFLINLSRGSGLRGLCGIPERENQITRPLLPFSRQEIHTYALKNNLQWREDKSNEEHKYLRNKIRKTVIPGLKELDPHFLNSFKTSINNLKGTGLMIDHQVESVLEKVLEKQPSEGESVLRFKLEGLQPYLEHDAYLYELFYKFGFKNWSDIRSLVKAQSGKFIRSRSHRLVKHGKYLLLGPNSSPEVQDPILIHPGEQMLTLDDKNLHFGLKNKTDTQYSYVSFDKDLLRFPLSVRKWKKGDYFYPAGMKGRKKLSKYFKDQKLSLFQKENIWLLCSGNEVVWVMGKRTDERFKPTTQTKNIYHIGLK